MQQVQDIESNSFQNASQTNLPTFMTIQACTMHIVLRRMLMGGLVGILNWGLYSKTYKLLTVVMFPTGINYVLAYHRVSAI